MTYEFENWKKAGEMESIYIMPEASEAIKATIINLGEVSPEKPILVGCSDDRCLTEASADALAELGLPVDRPYLRIFGAKYGLANIVLAASSAQHGKEHTIDVLGNDYYKVAEDLEKRAAGLGVILATHSDEGAEGNPAKLNTSTDAALACAKATNLGPINRMAEKEQLAIRVGEVDAEALLNQKFSPEQFNSIPTAMAVASQTYFGEQPAAFAVTRQAVIESNTPAMVLGGKHAPTSQVKHVYNMAPNKVSDACEAVSRNVYYYHTDIVPAAEIIMRSYPELSLDPAILMQTIILDASATRMALSALDGEADPSRLEAVKYGDPTEGLNHLYEVSQSLS